MLKRQIAFKARSDWLLRISFDIRLQATLTEFAPENFAGIDELKLSFCAILSHFFSIY